MVNFLHTFRHDGSFGHLYSPLLPHSHSLWFNTLPFPWWGYMYVYKGACFVGKHICCTVEILHYSMYLTIFRTYEIAQPPQHKSLGGRGPQTDEQLTQNPFPGHFLRWRHFALPSMSLIFPLKLPLEFLARLYSSLNQMLEGINTGKEKNLEHKSAGK